MRKYIREEQEKSYCPNCGKRVEWVHTDDDSPSFYICFDCHYVGQLGVGEVRSTLDGTVESKNEGRLIK